MDHAAFQSWLRRYIDAWRSNDAATIGDLFAAGATYRYHPWDKPLQGRDAIVRDWLESPDVPDSWQADYRPVAVEGNVGVAIGESRYLADDRSSVDRTYHNVFVCRFDDDARCIDFTEWFMEEKRAAG